MVTPGNIPHTQKINGKTDVSGRGKSRWCERGRTSSYVAPVSTERGINNEEGRICSWKRRGSVLQELRRYGGVYFHEHD